MECNKFEQYLMEEMSPQDFVIHCKSCTECSAKLAADEKLMHTASLLNENQTVPDLWPQILTKIEEPAKPHTLYSILKYAAVFILAVTALFYTFKPSPKLNTPLLSDKALQKVEATEQAYEEAIDELEVLASVKMDTLEITLALLYRDKLETIDTQIERCRNALETNPANTHIRRYLLAALDDKKQTLKEIIIN